MQSLQVYPAYVNSLVLKDEAGNELALEENGEGSFKDYVMNFVLAAASKEVGTAAQWRL